jgi:hypothetical protein
MAVSITTPRPICSNNVAFCSVSNPPILPPVDKVFINDETRSKQKQLAVNGVLYFDHLWLGIRFGEKG